MLGSYGRGLRDPTSGDSPFPPLTAFCWEHGHRVGRSYRGRAQGERVFTGSHAGSLFARGLDRRTSHDLTALVQKNGRHIHWLVALGRVKKSEL
jgi:hypothetical protein